jgi:hypothetical protein
LHSFFFGFVRESIVFSTSRSLELITRCIALHCPLYYIGSAFFLILWRASLSLFPSTHHSIVLSLSFAFVRDSNFAFAAIATYFSFLSDRHRAMISTTLMTFLL